MNAHRKIIKDNARSLLKIIAKQYNCNYFSALFQILKEHPNAPSFPVSYTHLDVYKRQVYY